VSIWQEWSHIFTMDTYSNFDLQVWHQNTKCALLHADYVFRESFMAQELFYVLRMTLTFGNGRGNRGTRIDWQEQNYIATPKELQTSIYQDVWLLLILNDDPNDKYFENVFIVCKWSGFFLITCTFFFCIYI